ncbi:MAG: hypothetical protein ACI9BF_000119 [Candidatus Paceibacteria bacterium]|jgi:hypothetical protein
MSQPDCYIAPELLREKCESEGIDFTQVKVNLERWHESKYLDEGVLSALVRPDLIFRDDGSFVYLDRVMMASSLGLSEQYAKGKANPDNLPWTEFVESVTEM